MPIITFIKPQKNQKRVNVYLDGKFGFGLDLENFVKLNLKVEQELSENEIEEIVKKALFAKTLDNLLRFATLRPRSEKEIKDWFRKKRASGPGGPLARRVHESLHDKLFNRLKKLELVDDQKFARWWIEQRLAFRPRPKRILNQELRIKGVDKNTIDDVLAEVKIDEKAVIKKLLAKNAYKWRKYDAKTARLKTTQYLARKGFSWEVIKACLREKH